MMLFKDVPYFPDTHHTRPTNPHREENVQSEISLKVLSLLPVTCWNIWQQAQKNRDLFPLLGSSLFPLGRDPHQ